MHSAVIPDSLEDALAAAVCRYDGASPLTPQVHHHFGYEADALSGRRLRMRLVLVVAAEEGAAPPAALDAACAVEILHNASLVHDDIEDGDVLRGGRASVWSHYGLAHGINAGDALSAIAYLQVLAAPDRLPERVVDVTRVLQEANYAMCAGRARDIGFRRAPSVGRDEYLAMVEGKQAALIAAACEIGAVVAGASAERAQAYARLGRSYALSYQIEDDVLGVWSDPPGDRRWTALMRRRWSYPVVDALAGPPSTEQAALAALYAAGVPLDAAAAVRAGTALDRLGAREAALAAARRSLADADADAAAAAVDTAGRVRAFFRHHLRRAA